MSIEQHVTSLELSKRLKELGVSQKSLFHHWCRKNYWSIVYGQQFNKDNPETYSAFLASELGKMLKWQMLCIFGTPDDLRQTFFSEKDTEANARAKMLIYLIENNHVSAGDL